MSAALRAHRRFYVFLAVLVPVLLYFVLLATGSLVVVPYRILTTCSLAVVPSVILSHHLLLGCGSVCASFSESLCGGLHFPGCLACTSNTTTHHRALRDRWLAVGARAPWSCSSQQRVLLTVRTGLRGSLPLRSVGGFQHHSYTCVILWAVSTFITKAYIAASCHVGSPLPFTCAHDSLSCQRHLLLSFTMRSAAIAVLVLDASLLHCTRSYDLSAGCGYP